MKRNLTVTISSLALIALLIIQSYLFYKIYQLNSSTFDEKAKIILSRTTEDLSNYLENNDITDGINNAAVIAHTDSVIKRQMKFYDFKYNYSFKLLENNKNLAHYYVPTSDSACYDKTINDLNAKNSWKLELKFENNELNNMSKDIWLLIIITTTLILIIIYLFVQTISKLIIEKRIAENTTDYINNMAHEFKTPITNIQLATKFLLSNNSANNSKQKIYSEIILSENNLLAHQVDQILSISALEKGDIPLILNNLDFHSLIYEAINRLQILIEKSNTNIELNLEAEKCVIKGDKFHLSDVVKNLIENGIKYSIGNPKLHIKTYNSGTNFIFEITDSGIGIEPRYQKRVFEKYFRVPNGNIQNVRGFGLGLAYIKKIIDSHHGKIDLFSELEKGSRFTITLSIE